MIFDQNLNSYCFVRESDNRFDKYATALDSINWKEELSQGGILTRFTSWLVPEGCCCDYKYGRSNHPFSHFPPWLVDLTQELLSLIHI